MSSAKRFILTINGKNETVEVPAHRTLLEALRGLGHVEVKSGCEKGDCGACAVLVDGAAVDSCLTLAWMVEGREITTITGLGDIESPHPLQKTFTDLGAIQCGYCTPGIIMAAKSLIDQDPEPSEEAIRIGLSGNLCRCTGYTKVFQAVQEAASIMRSEGMRDEGMRSEGDEQ
jgi:carbon-monoxide dehydrogenase small subunit